MLDQYQWYGLRPYFKTVLFANHEVRPKTTNRFCQVSHFKERLEGAQQRLQLGHEELQVRSAAFWKPLTRGKPGTASQSGRCPTWEVASARGGTLQILQMFRMFRWFFGWHFLVFGCFWLLPLEFPSGWHGWATWVSLLGFHFFQEAAAREALARLRQIKVRSGANSVEAPKMSLIVRLNWFFRHFGSLLWCISAIFLKTNFGRKWPISKHPLIPRPMWRPSAMKRWRWMASSRRRLLYPLKSERFPWQNAIFLSKKPRTHLIFRFKPHPFFWSGLSNNRPFERTTLTSCTTVKLLFWRSC